eukprot:3396782-Pleurochrysis_carterae.AAC.1
MKKKSSAMRCVDELRVNEPKMVLLLAARPWDLALNFSLLGHKMTRDKSAFVASTISKYFRLAMVTMNHIKLAHSSLVQS